METRYREQLQAKDEQIEIYRQQNTNMTEIVKTLASRPINVEVNATASGQDTYNQTGNVGIGHNSGTVSDNATAAGIANEKDPP